MPTVSLTPQQQAQVDAANAQLASAKAALDAANLELSNREVVARTSFNAVMLCSGYKGKVKNFEPLEKSVCATCLKNCGNCGGMGASQVNTCKSRVETFNIHYNNWYAQQATVSSRQNDYDVSKVNLLTVLDAISKDPTHNLNADIIKYEIEAQGSKDNIKWMFFGLAAVIIVGVAIWIGTRMLRGGAAA